MTAIIDGIERYFAGYEELREFVLTARAGGMPARVTWVSDEKRKRR